MRRVRETLDNLEISSPLNDPIAYVRGLESPEDIEVGGFIVSAIAYGRISRIMADTRRLLDITGNHPAEFVAKFTVEQAGVFDGFKHRFTRGEHIACLMVRLRCALEEYGSLHALFHEGWARSGEMRAAISHFVERLRGYDCPGLCEDCRTPRRQSVRYLLSNPCDGGAAKRICLYLRWMIRDTYPDTGVWNAVPKSALVIPLDTHLARIGRLLGLTQRRSSDWQTAVEITDGLKRLDAYDPVRYDYALSHLGIDGKCSGKFDAATCETCAVKDLCGGEVFV